MNPCDTQKFNILNRTSILKEFIFFSLFSIKFHYFLFNLFAISLLNSYISFVNFSQKSWFLEQFIYLLYTKKYSLLLPALIYLINMISDKIISKIKHDVVHAGCNFAIAVDGPIKDVAVLIVQRTATLKKFCVLWSNLQISLKKPMLQMTEQQKTPRHQKAKKCIQYYLDFLPLFENRLIEKMIKLSLNFYRA